MKKRPGIKMKIIYILPLIFYSQAHSSPREILLVGDSNLLGNGLRKEQSVSEQLKRTLSRSLRLKTVAIPNFTFSRAKSAVKTLLSNDTAAVVLYAEPALLPEYVDTHGVSGFRLKGNYFGVRPSLTHMLEDTARGLDMARFALGMRISEAPAERALEPVRRNLRELRDLLDARKVSFIQLLNRRSFLDPSFTYNYGTSFAERNLRALFPATKIDNSAYLNEASVLSPHCFFPWDFPLAADFQEGTTLLNAPGSSKLAAEIKSCLDKHLD